MKSEKTAKDTAANKKCLLEISLHAVPSGIKVSGGKEIPFSRAMLSMRNSGNAAAFDIEPHATLGQEGGSVQDVSEGLIRGKTLQSIPPGGTLEWDIYDQLLPAHPGAASKVHMFGYRAVLNWWFDVTAWIKYRCPDVDASLQTPVFKWKLRWSLIRDPEDTIDLSITVIDENQL